MNKILLSTILMGALFLFGCYKPEGQAGASKGNKSSKPASSNSLNLHSNIVANIVASGASKIDIEKTVLEEAQRNYQNSYNEYVRCLRESGPQTLETLQALTIYQKNYQIYQMLLKAEAEKK